MPRAFLDGEPVELPPDRLEEVGMLLCPTPAEARSGGAEGERVPCGGCGTEVVRSATSPKTPPVRCRACAPAFIATLWPGVA